MRLNRVALCLPARREGAWAACGGVARPWVCCYAAGERALAGAMSVQHEQRAPDEGQRDPFIGQRLGRYQIQAALGRGNNSAVYAARDLIIGRTVAIKILDPAVARDAALRERFLRDANALSRLRHPHILPIYEVAERDGVAYLARQQTEGGTFRGYLTAAGLPGVAEVGALLRPIAAALDYAHRQGFVHGNLRPSNILRTTDGQIFLTDFIVPGEEAPVASAATTIISALDAPEYASPEQARSGGAVASADLYVLGVILYEALIGRPPFRAEGPEESARSILTRHLQAPPPAPRTLNPTLGPAVEAVLLRALAKRRGERYPTAAALLYALGEAQEHDQRAAQATAPAADRDTAAPVSASESGTPDAGPGGAAALAGSPHPTPGLVPTSFATLPAFAQRWIVALIGLTALLAGMLIGLLLVL